jgi:hypothetical protein
LKNRVALAVSELANSAISAYQKSTYGNRSGGVDRFASNECSMNSRMLDRQCFGRNTMEDVPATDHSPYAEGSMMSWRQFFDVLGLPIPDVREAWPEDPLASLKKKFERTYCALVRRRRAIESLRLKIECDERRMGTMTEDARLSLARRRQQLQRREADYEHLLARMARIKRKQALLQAEMHAAK